MKTKQYLYNEQKWQEPLETCKKTNWVLAFGARQLMSDENFREDIISHFPNADIIGCTTSGEILGTDIYDETMVLTAVNFDSSHIKVFDLNISECNDSFDAGSRLASQLDSNGLKHVFVISDGQKVNGTALVQGLTENLPVNMVITGGLAGDADKFTETVVWHNNVVASGTIIICGIYGEKIKTGHGSVGGWDTFGPDRLITHSEDNVLYALDEENALALYKQYLGDYSNELPSSALLFPLAITLEEGGDAVVRTILSIDEAKGSMTFAGDMPQGSYARLMRANFERLIDGAQISAENSLQSFTHNNADLAILISCVGRRLVLGQRTEEELESVKEILGENTQCCGFYSYGEISPLMKTTQCQLHNQTMTVTTFTETS